MEKPFQARSNNKSTCRYTHITKVKESSTTFLLSNYTFNINKIKVEFKELVKTVAHHFLFPLGIRDRISRGLEMKRQLPASSSQLTLRNATAQRNLWLQS